MQTCKHYCITIILQFCYSYITKQQHCKAPTSQPHTTTTPPLEVITIRNANGHGSVYKLSGKRRKPWVARITTGWTSKGKQVRQIIGYFETKSEARAALNAHQVDPVSPKATITLGELYEEWAASRYKKLTKSTADNYRAAWNYLNAHKDIKMRDLRTAHLQQVVDGCEASGKSRSTLEKIKTVAIMLYNYALQEDIVKKNYAQFVELPRVDKTEKQRFTDFEVKKIYQSSLDGLPWADTVAIMIYTGMRISEMLNLTRFNVDMENNSITGGVKTDAGKNRIIALHHKIIPFVQSWYDKGGETLICRNDGKPIRPDYYRRQIYYPLLEEIGVRKLNPHCCRHTWVTMMAEAGADPRLTQEMAGHAKLETTAGYTHPDIEALRKAVNLIP